MNNLHDEEIVESVSKVNVDDSILKAVDETNIEKVGIFKSFWRSIKNAIFDFFQSFKYNEMKLSGILICVPGIFLGFFISFHQAIIKLINLEARVDGELISSMPDLTAICFFALILLGTLNLFTGFQAMNKKNLGSVVTATILTVLLTAVAGFYIYEIVYSWWLQVNGFVSVKGDTTSINPASLDFIMTMLSCGVSVVSSIAGVVLGYINYDRTYRKKDSK
jgi:hypothetical protein